MNFIRIGISNLRVVSHADFEPGTGINLISGPNGSGKTSLLEAIYLFGRGVSFKERRLRSIIRDGQDRLSVVGTALKSDRRLQVRVHKSRVKTDVTVNAEPISRLSVLARMLPVQIVTPNIQSLFEREAVFRRRLIDWGLFHVEPRFQEISSRYKKVLSQRNRALRNGDNSYTAWEPELVRLSALINNLRKDYVDKLTAVFLQLMNMSDIRIKLDLVWKSGWNKKMTFTEALERNRETDLANGYTQAGPHRADFTMLADNERLASRGSRGEQKFTAIGLLIAQNMLISKKNNDSPVLLLDDLASEFDEVNRGKIVSLLSSLTDCQIFITTLDPDMFHDIGESRVFHVEHGVVSGKSV